MKLLKKLIPKDSFYLVLFTCISVLGASAVWVSREKIDISEKPEVKQEIIEEQRVVEEEIKLDLNEEISKLEVVPPKEDVSELEKPEPKPEPIPEPEPEPIPEPKPEPEPEPKEEAKEKSKEEIVQKEIVKNIPVEKPKEQDSSQTESVTSKSVEVKNIKLNKPVEGKVYKDFSQDKLVYSKTLDEWSTHVGIDIAASEGTDVVAALEGVIKQVIRDERLGITIILDHGDGLETVYKNIATDKVVKVGQKVKAGDVISKVSKGVGLEKSEEPHLHFEVLKGGVNVDPKSFF